MSTTFIGVGIRISQHSVLLTKSTTLTRARTLLQERLPPLLHALPFIPVAALAAPFQLQHRFKTPRTLIYWQHTPNNYMPLLSMQPGDRLPIKHPFQWSPKAMDPLGTQMKLHSLPFFCLWRPTRPRYTRRLRITMSSTSLEVKMAYSTGTPKRLALLSCLLK